MARAGTCRIASAEKANLVAGTARILERVVDRIQELGAFRETNWNARTIVEITGLTKSHGWFFHAITGETWLLKMKFRTTKGSFRREQIVSELDLKTLNEMHDLPIYGNEPRVRCKTLRGPWQEIELRVHTWDEIDKPAFWDFLEKAVQGFQSFAERAATNPEELMPWKRLGPHWHLSRRGFPARKAGDLGGHRCWNNCASCSWMSAGPRVDFHWNNQQIVHVGPTDQPATVGNPVHETTRVARPESARAEEPIRSGTNCAPGIRTRIGHPAGRRSMS